MKSIFIIGGIFFFLFSASSVIAQPPAKALVEKECIKCHSFDRVKKANKNIDAWRKTVDLMISKGAKIKPEERDAVVKYLNTFNR
jgi:hypothetical protein